MPDGPPSESEYEFAPKPEAVTPPAAAPLPRGAPGPDVPAADEFEAARICPHCGFRMVSKPVRGRCPECAAALDEVATDLLQFADRKWVIGVSNGVLLLAGSVVPQALASVMVSMGWPAGSLVHAIGGIAGTIGIWAATATEPGIGAARSPLALPAKIAALVAGLMWVLPFLSSRLADSNGFTMAVLLAMAVQTVLIALHLRTIAGRIPNDSLGSHLTNAGILSAGICVVLGGMNVLNVVNRDYLRLFFFCAFPMIGVMALVVLWAVWSLIRLALELRSCAAAGEHIVARQALRAQAAAAKRA